MTSEDRFSMTAERYLAKHNILVYLEDSISQLLEHREENPKVNPIKFLNLLSIQEYHSLLSLLCSDFPFEPVQKTARIILLDDAMDCLISFGDFIYAFQVQFYYEEFLDKCHELYQSLLQTQRSPRDPVVVPSGSDDARVHQNSHHPADGVDAMQYFRAVYQICDRSQFSNPPVNSLKEILFNVPRVSFYGFLMAIAKRRLPSKSELLEGADSELTSPAIRMKTRISPSPSSRSASDATVTQNSQSSSSTTSGLPPAAPKTKSSNQQQSKSGQHNHHKSRKESSDESSTNSETDDTSDDDTL
ncbi:hypothetical protein KUTeg_023676 [Tegillarca granosa]|uniref:Centriolar satellite-associated tubulin polyglutamylase complex regulator 1 n=1 Tax=Tegillarca granosa TaxID=220873 RepID=A0ABQ9E2C9_TEGGR|nr:hypothetical protein KUTeg_023676 [Tegillarca granosa]